MTAISANSNATLRLQRHAPLLAYLLRALLLALLGTVGGSLDAQLAQSVSSTQHTKSHSPRPFARKLPKAKPADGSKPAGSSVSTGSTRNPQSKTQSIVKPATYEEVVIPSAIDSMRSGSSNIPTTVQVESVECDAGPLAGNMYDYITSDKSVGRHYFLLDWSRADLWIGTASFVNPGGAFKNNGGATIGQVQGSFGFQEGFNFGSQLPSLLSGQIGSQIGMRFIQSNLEGTNLSTASRNQVFLTAGLFRRVDYGFQGGAVVDYFRQQWIENVDLLQVRGELSFLFSPVHEIGFRCTENGRISATNVRIPSLGTTVTARSRTLDTYRLFLRRRFGACSASMVEVNVGTSNDGGVVMGALLQNPLTGQLGLESSATYFSPKQSTARPQDAEAWSMGIALVWTPGRAFGTSRDYNRPLFEVAGNSSMIHTRP